jgi:hypothetical protein
VNGTHTFGGAYTVNGAVAGEYNQNAAVDAADYVLWRKSSASFGGDPGGYDTWRQNYGTGSGTLGGTGTISESVLVNPGGTLAPGVSIGTLTVDSAEIAGKLRVDYDGSSSTIDKLVVNNDLNITNAALDFNKLSVAALSGGPYIFASYGSLSGAAFASVANLPTGFSINYNYLSGNQIALVSAGSGSGASLRLDAAVPEPTALVLMVTAIVGAFIPRQRR